jgi:hypothetical protein
MARKEFCASFVLLKASVKPSRIASKRLNVQPQAARAKCCKFDHRCARLGGCDVLLGVPLGSILRVL